MGSRSVFIKIRAVAMLALLGACNSPVNILSGKDSGKPFIRNSSQIKNFGVNFSCFDKDRELSAYHVVPAGATYYPTIAEFRNNASAADPTDFSGYRRASKDTEAALNILERLTSEPSTAHLDAFRNASAKLGDVVRAQIEPMTEELAREFAEADSAANQEHDLEILGAASPDVYGVNVRDNIVHERGRANSKRSESVGRAAQLVSSIAITLRSQPSLAKYNDEFCDEVVVRNFSAKSLKF